MLCHPCILGDPQRQARGAKSEVVPNKEEQSWKWLSHRCLLGGPKEGGNATFSGIPNAKRGEQNQKWLPNPYLLGGPKEGGNARSPLHSRGSAMPSTGEKIRSGYLTPAFSGPPKKGEMLCHRYILGDPQCQAQRTKSEVATPPLPCRGPRRGQKCNVAPTFSGIPNAKREERNQKWLPHLCLLGSPKEGGNATPPLHSWGSPIPSTGNNIKRWLPQPCVLGGPKEGGNAMSPLHSEGSAMPSAGNKIRSGCLTLAFSGAQKRAEMLRDPAFSGVPKQGFKKGPRRATRKKPVTGVLDNVG